MLKGNFCDQTAIFDALGVRRSWLRSWAGHMTAEGHKLVAAIIKLVTFQIGDDVFNHSSTLSVLTAWTLTDKVSCRATASGSNAIPSPSHFRLAGSLYQEKFEDTFDTTTTKTHPFTLSHTHKSTLKQTAETKPARPWYKRQRQTQLLPRHQ